jgi:6-phosphofructokinase
MPKPAPVTTRLAVARIGLLTGGGDCPGLNAVIRAAVRSGLPAGHSFVGFRYGWAGVLLDPELYETAELFFG